MQTWSSRARPPCSLDRYPALPWDADQQGLYGSEFSRETKEWKATHTNDNIFVIKSFDMYRASDWSLMLVLLLLTGFAFAGVSEGHPIASPSDIVLFTVAARLLGTFVIGYILARQDRTQFWTAHFSSTGLDARLAFDEWKRLYNLISSIMCAAAQHGRVASRVSAPAYVPSPPPP